jgi:predicted thioesterase
MKQLFKIGDIKRYSHLVTENDTAKFESGEVHPVYSTFSLARDAEWCCRLFVLDMKEPHEEGIGTRITVEHLSPAKLGDTVEFIAKIISIERNEIICAYTAKVGNRLIAKGEQGQKILAKEKLQRIFASL